MFRTTEKNRSGAREAQISPKQTKFEPEAQMIFLSKPLQGPAIPSLPTHYSEEPIFLLTFGPRGLSVGGLLFIKLHPAIFLEQRVNERRYGRTAQEDEQTQKEQYN